MQTRLAFEYLLTPDGIRHDQALVVNAQGFIERIEPAQGARDGFFAVPGMPNAHSHAFQRALAGYGETAGGEDSFWSWREAMYRLANRVSPDDLFVIAREAFLDMLRGGYTSVAEFHYLHHLPDGRPGPEMAQALIAAARETGIYLLLLPVYYETGGIGRPARHEQRRFVHKSVEEYCGLLHELHGAELGIAPHSLRAVPLTTMPSLIEGASKLRGTRFPIHIHISEQRQEVEECRAAYGATPIEVLARVVKLDHQWNLVHATHATAKECALIQSSGATVVLCPATEAYLGDGLFAADEFVTAGGRIAIGSDSNCRIDVLEELRLLEYGQRLRRERRARFATGQGLGIPLWLQACAGGALALGAPVGVLAPGQRADLLVFEPEASPLRGHEVDTFMDALVIGGSRHDIAAVYVGGKKRVDHGEVAGADESARQFARTALRLNEA